MTRWSCATLVFAMVLCAAPADAADGLYTGLAYVTGQMEETRLPGFGRALEEVLVKVSGDARLGADPRVAALTGEAARYVETFSYRDRMADIPVHDEQGTRERPFELTVAFVPQGRSTRCWRRSARRHGRIAPLSWCWLPVTTGGGLHYPLTSDGQNGRDFRDALAAEARRAGPDGKPACGGRRGNSRYRTGRRDRASRRDCLERRGTWLARRLGFRQGQRRPRLAIVGGQLRRGLAEAGFAAWRRYCRETARRSKRPVDRPGRDN